MGVLIPPTVPHAWGVLSERSERRRGACPPSGSALALSRVNKNLSDNALDLGVDLMKKDINALHEPVLFKEVLDFLKLSPGRLVVDCTVGGGGHAQGILERILPGGFLIGIDRDADALGLARERLKVYEGSFKLVHGNFKDIALILKDLNIVSVDGLLLDLGLSSYQLSDTKRGFSFRTNGPLDMRMDKTQELTAYTLVNHLDEEGLARIINDYSQEHFAKRIAREIIFARKKKSIQTTVELAGIILKSIPAKYRSRRLHPATRTFQALRIAVNNELDNLTFALDSCLDFISQGGRIAVISFHSLEDRIVKNKLRQFAKDSYVGIITKKPIVPSRTEILSNPRARSAKLRVGERL